jgi:hypothetical protein
MVAVPKKVADRLSKAVPIFQRVLANARDRDVNESDTVTIVTDILADVLGFDKYSEVTSEQAIRGTFCDLAIKLEGKIKYLIEVKAIGLTLKENHLRQAVNYGANQGIPWVVLTNGVTWEIYRIKFDRPVSHDLVCSFDFFSLKPRAVDDQGKLFLLCREGIAKAAIEEFHVQNVNKFIVGALIQSEAIVAVIRRELRRLSPAAKISMEEIQQLLPDVLKRDVLEGESATHAIERVKKAAKKSLTKVEPKKQSADPEPLPRPQQPLIDSYEDIRTE